jgi:hypothetical protein
VIDLSDVRSRLDAALEIVERLDGLDLVDTDSGNPTHSKSDTAVRQRAASFSSSTLRTTSR